MRTEPNAGPQLWYAQERAKGRPRQVKTFLAMLVREVEDKESASLFWDRLIGTSGDLVIGTAKDTTDSYG